MVKKAKPKFRPFYSPADWKAASPVLPIPQDRRDLTMAKFWAAFEALTTEETPHAAHWVTLTEAVNLMDAFVRDGYAKDPDNLIGDASAAMRTAARHMVETGTMKRLEGPLATALAALLHDFEVCFGALSQRSFMEVMNRCERLLWDAAYGGKKNDVEVFDFSAVGSQA